MQDGGYVEQELAGEIFNASTLTVFAQIPQFTVIGASEVFASITGEYRIGWWGEGRGGEGQRMDGEESNFGIGRNIECFYPDSVCIYIPSLQLLVLVRCLLV